jgi:nucleotide-binding universal stress UspA family protein
MMLNHILVPLDGSQLAEAAIQYAKQILGDHGKITLLTAVDVVLRQQSAKVTPQLSASHMFADPWIVSFEPTRKAQEEIARGLLRHSQDYLQHIADELQTAGVQAEVNVQSGVSPAEAIIETAKELDVDAIVISTHGRSGLSRWLFGSVTFKVLSAAPCSMFVIPSWVIVQHKLKEPTPERNVG